MKKVFVLLVLSIFLVSFAFAVSIEAVNQNSNSVKVTDGNSSIQKNIEAKTVAKEKVEVTATARLAKAIEAKNRLRAYYTNQSECPNNCTCSGSVVKCELKNGREMTVRAGNSGNVIVQVKGENMTTNVTLYQHEGKVYGIFRNNKTKVVNLLPDQVRERLREKIKAQLEIRNITLDENGTYKVEARKRARLFFIFPIKEKVRTEVNAETGQVIRTKISWWGFLARDRKQEQLVGGCGTVTPGQNDACCQNNGYDYWNSANSECEFNLSE